MKIEIEDLSYFRSNTHPAIVVRVDRPVKQSRAAEIFRAIHGAFEADMSPVDECLPLWVSFDNVDGSEFTHPYPVGFAPLSKSWLDGVVLAIPETKGYTKVRAYDYDVASGKVKKAKPSHVATGPKRSPFEDRLPSSLEFMKSAEAFAECRALATAIRAVEGVEAMERLIVSMNEGFPNLYRANLGLHGKLKRGMRLLAAQADLRLGVFDRFVSTIRECALHLLESDVDSMELGVYRWYHNDDGTLRDMQKFLGPGDGYDVLMGAHLSPVQDMNDESTQYGELGSIVTVRWLDKDRWKKMGKTNPLKEAVAEEEEVDA